MPTGRVSMPGFSTLSATLQYCLVPVEFGRKNRMAGRRVSGYPGHVIADQDYVLGTEDAEITRLGIQHRVWRPYVLDAWARAGIEPGMKVVDVGAGPGFVTIDLAEQVGRDGAVLAVERSQPVQSTWVERRLP